METLRDLFEHVLSISAGRKKLLRAKRGGKWHDISTEEFGRRVRELAAGFIAAGVRPGDRIALYSENRPEWHIFDFACSLSGAISVPLYPNLIADQVAYILEDAGARRLVVSTPKMLPVAARAAGLAGDVELIIIDPPEDGDGGLTTLASLEARGREWLKRLDKGMDPFHHPERDDVVSVIYTSGTTGDPKGVMLTHWNFVFDFTQALGPFDINEHDVSLSFLPLSHVFERLVDYALFARGTQIVYVEAIERVPGRLVEVKPTILVSVPRVFERSYIKIMSGIRQQEGMKRRFVEWALATGRRRLDAMVAGKRPSAFVRAQFRLARGRVFSKIIDRLGGRLRFAVCGGAPLSREVEEFFLTIGLPIYKGYGLTETSPVISVDTPQNHRIGSVGLPVAGVEVTIAEDGEILTRGDHVMKGYLNREAETREVIDPEGWFHTGDVGYLDADGFLFITDRKKDIIVTSGGKNVAPQPIEGKLQATPYITQAVVVGDRLPYLTALIVPNFENLATHFSKRGDTNLSAEEMARHPDTFALINEAIAGINRGLSQHEKVRKFALLDRELSLAEGEITPTLKVKRRVVTERYRDLIEGMYLKTQLTDRYHEE
ncbi:MAG: long-chain fatty acid--CoA ligase [Acidobacteria bacterium]|nr:long-chain fatty acid--CoA ligase [Acidobacteriota bacterium]